MKKEILLLLTAILSLNCYSQISFEKGYFINNNEEKIQCFIKNVDWENNPKDFKYKLLEKSDPKTASIAQIKEFGIYNYSKYIRSNVNIDRSSENVNKLSNSKRPIFQEEELFLKVLVESKASLYQYVDNNLNRFFYNKDNSNIEQLIFKSYKTTDLDKNNRYRNNRYRQQLWVDLKCPNFRTSKI